MAEPFTATLMIEVITLAVIAVRSSLLIGFISMRRTEGLLLQEAMMREDAVRLRPVILRALAIIVGSSIMTSLPVFGGLAISLIFDAFVSTTLALFVVPLVCYCRQG